MSRDAKSVMNEQAAAALYSNVPSKNISGVTSPQFLISPRAEVNVTDGQEAINQIDKYARKTLGK